MKTPALLVLLFLPALGFAQGDGDYQSKGSGAWSAVGTWQVYLSTNGVYVDLSSGAAGAYQNQIPNFPSAQPVGEIAIRAGHIVTVDIGVTLFSNPLLVEATAQLVVNNTAANPDISVDPNSFVYVQGLFALANGATHSGFDNSTTEIASGGVYEHRYTNTRGIIIGAQWDDGSTIRFNAYTNPGTFTGAENLDQDYYDFEWNCPQTGAIDFNGTLTTVRHNLTILSTDTGAPSNDFLRIFGNADGILLEIGGDLTISGTSSVAFTTNGSNTLQVEGNYSNSASIRTTFGFGTGTIDFNIFGDYSQTGTAVTRFTGNAAATCNLNLNGNFSHATSGITNTALSQPNLNFVSGGTQTYTGTGTITGPLDYFVEGTTTLNMGTSSLRSVTGTFTLRSSATLMAGALNGSGTNANGAIQTGTTQGNIRVGGARTYEDESTIIYSGTAAQQMGNGHPSTTIVNTIISNSFGVTTVGARTISGDLTLTSGNLNAVAGSALTLNRDIIPGSNFITTTATSDFVINGDGLTGTFPFPSGAQTVRNFTLNRASGSLTFANNVTISTLLTLTDGALIFTGRTLTLNGSTSTVAGVLSSSSPTNTILNIGGSGAFGTLPMDGSPNNQVATFNFTRGGGGSLSNSGDLFVATAFNLTNGTFNNLGSLTLGNGCLLTRAAVGATITTNRPQVSNGNTYNVSLGGTYTTGFELPDPTNTTDLGNVTITSGTITLGQDVTINGTVALSGGAFAGGANTITMQGPNWTDDAGNFTTNTSTIVFNRASGTTVGGSSTPQLGSITLNNGASLTFPAGAINVSGDIAFGSSSTFNANGGTLSLNGGTASNFNGGGKTFTNITQAKAGFAVTLTGGVMLTGILNVTSNNTDFNSAGFLTLVSNASGTASIGSLLLNRTVSGIVNAQRYVLGVGRAYRDISSPVTTGTLLQVHNSGITITGTTPVTDFPCGGCATNGPSVYHYDEPTAGVLTQGYVANISSDDIFSFGKGYNVLVRNEVGTKTITLSGPINRVPAATALPVTFTNTGAGVDDGWNFIGNPLPSAIDWNSAAGWANKATITDNSIRIWDPTKNAPSGGYRVWDGGAGDLGSGRIAMGQGFWVKRTGAGAALTITEAVKSSTATSFYRTAEPDPTFFEIELRDVARNLEDFTYIKVNPDAKFEYDELDAPKLKSPVFNLVTKTKDGVSLAINLIDKIPVTPEEIIDLHISEVEPGNYTLKVNAKGDFDGMPVYLMDKLTGISTNISINAYTFEVTQSQASKSIMPPVNNIKPLHQSELMPESRFYLYFAEKKSGVTDIDVKVYPNPVDQQLNIIIANPLVQSEIHVLDVMGKSIGVIPVKEESGVRTGSFDMSNSAPGLYLVRYMKESRVEVTKFLKR